MAALQLSKPPVVETAMLIRKPVAEVFEAFVNPEVTTKFWFTKSSGRLDAGKNVVWTWEMYGVSAKVGVKTLTPNQSIVIEWGEPGQATTVEWLFEARGNDKTFVTIKNSGFAGDGDAIVARALDSMGGFTWLLAGCKAYLEHGLQLNLTGDRFHKDA